MNVRLAIKFWSLWFILGALSGFVTGWVIPSYEESAVRALTALPRLAEPASNGSMFLQVFLKNALAALTVIFLGPILCLLESRVYTTASEATYGFLERLTAPFYLIGSAIHPRFKTLAPFFRSCYFYLYFVPLLALAANGAALGFLFSFYPPEPFLAGLLPHGVLEFPAFLTSAGLALATARSLEEPIMKKDLEGLKEGLRRALSRDTLKKAGLILAVLAPAAYLEVGL